MQKRSALAAILLALVSTRAAADDTHYQDYPLGGRAVGLGGAFTAIANDPSGIFYNPAGTVDSARTSIDVSANLYGLELAVGDNIVGSIADRVKHFDTVFADLNIIPSSAGFVRAIGELDESGRVRLCYGLGAFVPSYRSINVQTSGAGPGSGDQITYRRNLLDQTLHTGAMIATRVDEVWSFGVTGFFMYRSLRDQEASAIFGGAANTAASPFNASETNLSATVGALLFDFGVKADFHNGWSFGAAVESPSTQIWQTAQLHVTRTRADPHASASMFDLYEPKNLTASTKTPGMLRIGVAHVIPATVTFSGDLNFASAVRYKLLSLPGDLPLGIDRGVSLATDIERRAVLNAAFGMEALIVKEFSIAFGMFTNFSSAPPIPGNTGDRFDRDYLPDVDAYGGSLVLGFFSDHVLSRVGLTASYGSGTDVIAQNQELAPLGSGGGWKKINVRELFLFFFLSSTFRY